MCDRCTTVTALHFPHFPPFLSTSPQSHSLDPLTSVRTTLLPLLSVACRFFGAALTLVPLGMHVTRPIMRPNACTSCYLIVPCRCNGRGNAKALFVGTCKHSQLPPLLGTSPIETEAWTCDRRSPPTLSHVPSHPKTLAQVPMPAA